MIVLQLIVATLKNTFVQSVYAAQITPSSIYATITGSLVVVALSCEEDPAVIVVQLIVPATSKGSLEVLFLIQTQKEVDDTLQQDVMSCVCSVSYIFTSVPAVIVVQETVLAIAYGLSSDAFLKLTTKRLEDNTQRSNPAFASSAVVKTCSVHTVGVPLDHVTIDA